MTDKLDSSTNKDKRKKWFKKWKPFLLLFIAIIAVSFAAPIVVILQNNSVPSVMIASYRTLFAGVGALIIASLNRDLKWIKISSTIKRSHWLFIAGLLLAIHFATWFLSLAYISVAISTTLVDTVPIFMAIFGFIIFKEKVNLMGVIGIILAVIGGMLLSFSTSNVDLINNSNIIGIALALTGALAVTFYFLIGKRILQDSPLWPYFGIVNLVSGVVLLIYSLIMHYSLVYSPIVFFYIVILAVGPSLIGHATYNYSLRNIAAFVVGTVIIAEPVGATILGIIFLHQIPDTISLLYALIIIAGILLTSISNVKNEKKKAETNNNKN